jgi:hypothetical protein
MTPLRLQVDQYRPAFDYEECPVNQLVTGISASLIVYNVRLIFWNTKSTFNCQQFKGGDLSRWLGYCMEDQKATIFSLQRIENHRLFGN